MAASVQLSRTATVACGRLARRLQESIGLGYLAVEVARVEFNSPDDLVDVTKLGDGELGRAERAG